MNVRQLVIGAGLVSLLGGVGAYYTGKSLTEEYLLARAQECNLRIGQTEDESRLEMLYSQKREYEKRIENWKPNPNKMYYDLAAVSLSLIGSIALLHAGIHDSNTRAH